MLALPVRNVAMVQLTKGRDTKSGWSLNTLARQGLIIKAVYWA